MADLTMHTLIARDFIAAGIALPEGAQRALDIYDAALQAANARPADELVALLNDGTLTAENVGEIVVEASMQQVARDKAHELLRDLLNPLARTFAGAIRDDADRILRDLRKMFGPAAKVVQRAGELFPLEATGEDVLAAGEQASASWRELQQARQTLDKVRSIRASLARTYGIGAVEPEVLAYTKGITSQFGQLQAVELWNSSDPFTGGRWHALAAAGFTLALPTPAEVASTRAAIAQTEQDAVDAQRAADIAQAQADARLWAFPHYAA